MRWKTRSSIGPIDRPEVSSIIQLAHVERERKGEQEKGRKRALVNDRSRVLEKEDNGDSEIDKQIDR